MVPIAAVVEAGQISGGNPGRARPGFRRSGKGVRRADLHLRRLLPKERFVTIGLLDAVNEKVGWRRPVPEHSVPATSADRFPCDTEAGAVPTAEAAERAAGEEGVAALKARSANPSPCA
jgi:hypothetical protein